jgi:hypothetical protein
VPELPANRPTYCDLAMPLCFGGKRLDGSTALCGEEGPIHSHFFGQSSFASHAIVPQRTAVKMDKDLPLEKLGPLGCGVVTGAGGVIEALKVGFGDTIAVFGTGGVGLSAVMAAKLVGAKRIVAVDLNRERLELAREFGATDCIAGDEDDLAAKIRASPGAGSTSPSTPPPCPGGAHAGRSMPGDERHRRLRRRAAGSLGRRKCSPCSRAGGSCAASSAAMPTRRPSCRSWRSTGARDAAVRPDAELLSLCRDRPRLRRCPCRARRSSPSC